MKFIRKNGRIIPIKSREEHAKGVVPKSLGSLALTGVAVHAGKVRNVTARGVVENAKVARGFHSQGHTGLAKRFAILAKTHLKIHVAAHKVRRTALIGSGLLLGSATYDFIKSRKKK